MSWDDLDKDIEGDLRDASKVSGQDHERRVIKNNVNEQFPGMFTDEQIDKAIDECLATGEESRPRDKFMNCLKGKLFS